MQAFDSLIAVLVRAVCATLRVLPGRFRESIVAALFVGAFVLVPKQRKIAERNISQAFPTLTPDERSALFWRSIRHLGVVFSDFCRLPRLTKEWFSTHVEFPGRADYERLCRDNPGKGILIVTGHLGSFELLAYAAPFMGRPLSMVIRNFTLPRVDAWWNGIRERHGNRIISRRGAVQEVIRSLQSGRDVGILFDQNVTKKHAVFVPFFGRPAATTRTVAVAALRTGAPVAVVVMHRTGFDRYLLDFKVCDIEDLRGVDADDTDRQVQAVTERVTVLFESMVRQFPDGWFWMHRRWRTTPDGVPSELYREL